MSYDGKNWNLTDFYLTFVSFSVRCLSDQIQTLLKERKVLTDQISILHEEKKMLQLKYEDMCSRIKIMVSPEYVKKTKEEHQK